MAGNGSEKKSRFGATILFLGIAILAFVLIGILLSAVTGSDDGDSFFAGIFGSDNKVAVVPVEGTITTADDLLKQLRSFKKKSSVKAIVLRINSPGGAVAPAQELFREVGRIKKDKPVVASIETVGASAAYYIASNSDRIVCSRGTITGSIGVIMVLAQFNEVIEKLGINVNVIKAGKFKDIGSALRPLTEKERKILEDFANEVHEQFIQDVAEGRKGKIDIEKIREVADGRWFTGSKAHEMGLVDTMGNFYDAVKIAAELGGIEEEPDLIYPEKEWGGYLDLFVESTVEAAERALLKSRSIIIAPSVQ